MSRLFGYLANQADRLSCSLTEEQAALKGRILDLVDGKIITIAAT
jgi:hypothetical protein